MLYVLKGHVGANGSCRMKGMSDSSDGDLRLLGTTDSLTPLKMNTRFSL